jgi:hypothetical protein
VLTAVKLSVLLNKNDARTRKYPVASTKNGFDKK